MTDKPRYELKLELFEVPRYINGNHSGKLRIETQIGGSTKEQIRRQLEQLLELFYESWQRPRDKHGHFMKSEMTEGREEGAG